MSILADVSHVLCAFADIWQSCTGSPQGDEVESHGVLYCTHIVQFVSLVLVTCFFICLPATTVTYALHMPGGACLLISCHVILYGSGKNLAHVYVLAWLSNSVMVLPHDYTLYLNISLSTCMSRTAWDSLQGSVHGGI